MSENMEMEVMEQEAISEEGTEKGNLGLVLGLGALGGLAIGAAVNGVVKGIKKLKGKKDEKTEEKPKKDRTPFWKRKKKEANEDTPADEAETEEKEES